MIWLWRAFLLCAYPFIALSTLAHAIAYGAREFGMEMRKENESFVAMWAKIPRRI